ncbi:MAG: tRNA ((37)-N6)-threonylcarbamoyltransferase complex ATPase subunit type 1 TsaE [Bacteriovoracaceae bacterium]|nr:tRNA ((37)-N6)-threonylcarbamoyltransferase complex ATPase subunit type 1 TsaE [Bacteriovoracaceae bacterium]
MLHQFLVSKELELKDVAQKLLQILKPGDWVALEGELGAGKTTLVRHVLFEMGYKDPVVSPTYPLLVEYDMDGQKIIHIDGFRLDGKSPDPWDFREWEKDILFVEWSEKTRLPRSKFKLRIRLEIVEEVKRSITFFSV